MKYSHLAIGRPAVRAIKAASHRPGRFPEVMFCVRPGPWCGRFAVVRNLYDKAVVARSWDSVPHRH